MFYERGKCDNSEFSNNYYMPSVMEIISKDNTGANTTITIAQPLNH